MTDVALIFDPATQAADIAVQAGGLATDDGLLTAIIISLFTDARARDDDVLPQAGSDRRGWWGDCLNADQADRIGSRLWLLEREKLTPSVALKARDIVAEALAWLAESGVVRSIGVETEIHAVEGSNLTGALAIGVTIDRPQGPGRERYDFVWNATARSFAIQ